MDVAPHPHTGLQTVSWLFEGEIEHRDALGVHALVRPGELNLMTAGSGVCHSEQSTTASDTLHGVQLWVALPDATRHNERAFEHHVPPAVQLDGAVARVLIGTLEGVDTSPVSGHTPLLGAEIVIEAHAPIELRLDAAFEHAVLLDVGSVRVDDTDLSPGQLALIDQGVEVLTLTAGSEGARLMLLGGEPFEEEVIMWWNFLGRSHEEVAAFRDEWNAHGERFGAVEGYEPLDEKSLDRIPAPGLPGGRLLPTVRRGRRTSSVN